MTFWVCKFYTKYFMSITLLVCKFYIKHFTLMSDDYMHVVTHNIIFGSANHWASKESPYKHPLHLCTYAGGRHIYTKFVIDRPTLSS